MESQGYDGLIYENTSGNEVGLSGEIDHTAYIVFRPEQIKSAVGNNGDFDPNNPNPTKSMIRKGMVAGYTKKDGTVVQGYETSRTKKAEDAPEQKKASSGKEFLPEVTSAPYEKSGWHSDIRTMEGDVVDVFSNPSRRDILEITKEKRGGIRKEKRDVRGFADGDDLYVYDSYRASHNDARTGSDRNSPLRNKSSVGVQFDINESGEITYIALSDEAYDSVGWDREKIRELMRTVMDTPFVRELMSADDGRWASEYGVDNEAKSMIRKGMVAGYTKKDGTVVKPYQTSRTKKADDALAPKNISSEWIKLTKLLNKFNDDGQHDLYDEMNAAKESFEQAVNDEAKQGQGESNKDYLARLTKKHDRLKSSHRNSEELRRQFPSRIHQLEKSNILLRARDTLGRAREVAKTKVEKEQIGIAPVLQSAKKLEEASAQNRGSHVLGRMNRDLRDEVMKAASTRKDESYEMFHARIARCRVFVSKEMNDASNTHQNILSAIDRQLTAANYRKQVTAKVVGQVGLHAMVGNPDPNSIIESQYYDGQKERSVEQFGLTPSEIAKLAGTTASADVEISYDGNEIGIKSEDGFRSERIIMKDRGGDPYIYNSWFSVNVKGEGLGSTILARQVQNAINHGFAKIKCSAARGNAMTGYYVWPLLGYDGPVPDKFSNPDRFRGPSRAEFEEEFKNLPENLKNATMVSEFFKTQEGMEFWKKWGLTFDATFDLSEGSYSRRWFAHRIERKENVAA
jgi:hypothetical protein